MNFLNQHFWLNVTCLLLIFAGIYSANLGRLGFEYRDDEVFYVKSTTEMLANENYLSPTYFGENRFQKPILYYWFIFTAYFLTDQNSIAAARLTSVVFALLTIFITILWARKLFQRESIALFAGTILGLFPLFFRHAQNAVPDMAFTFFITVSCYYLWKMIQPTSKRNDSLLFFIAMASGFMVKGFMAILYPVALLVIWLFVEQDRAWLKKVRWGWGFFVFLLLTIPWFWYMVVAHGQDYVQYMLGTETSDRLVGDKGFNLFEWVKGFGKHFFFYLKVILQYTFPLSLFVFGALFCCFKRWSQLTSEYRFLSYWVSFGICFHSLMYFIISHYMLPLMIPLAMLTASFFFSVLPRINDNLAKILRYSLYGVIFLIISGLIVLKAFVVVDYIWMAYYTALLIVFLLAIRKLSFVKCIALSLLLVFSQMYLNKSYWIENGFTTHQVLHDMADVIYEHNLENVPIAVGSHDLHEKEWQMYFQQPIKKLNVNDDTANVFFLGQYLRGNDKAICLINQQDYDKFLWNISYLEVLERKKIVRRRFTKEQILDYLKDPFNRQNLESFLKEDILLVKKEKPL